MRQDVGAEMPGYRMIEIRDLIGKPYKVHGRGPDSYDCYGLAIEACKRFGKILPDAIYSETDRIQNAHLIDSQKPSIQAIRVEKPSAGVVVALKVGGVASHIGVCLGDGNFIHCEKNGVRVETLASWNRRTEGFYTWQ